MSKPISVIKTFYFSFISLLVDELSKINFNPYIFFKRIQEDRCSKGVVCQILHTARCTNVIRLGASCPSFGTHFGYENRFNNFSRINLQTMKKRENEVRRKMVVTRMNHSEFERMEKFRKQSTERSVSNYIRKVMTQKPVTMKYRNQSADDFLNQMLELKKDLNGIGNNFNQAVHKLHILDKIPEFREWILHYQNLHKSIIEKVEEIKLRMNQLYDQWLQK